MTEAFRTEPASCPAAPRAADRHRQPGKRAIVCLLAATLLSGCDGDDRPDPRPATERARTFTAEDRRVARFLSLGTEPEDAVRTPFEEAAICEIALTNMQSRISATVSLDQNQRAGLRQAIAVFRARQAAANLPPAEQSTARRRMVESVIDDAYWGRVAIGCLRSLG